MPLPSLDGFLALLTCQDEPALQELADTCVREFDAFRAPPSTLELERRRAGALTDRQRGYLEAWGYPFVFEEYRFHMTLSCRLEAPERARFQEILRAKADGFNGDGQVVDAICLFEQADRSAPFRLTGRYVFG